MSEYAPLLAALIAFLIGLTIGKAWERYKLRGGKWIDRRRARQSPHYILGLNFLVANQIDLAIEELTRAASVDSEALEVHMILGNLYREKGQVGKAITMHQALLQRSRLSRVEHAYVLLCLGLDYRRGGFVDRALEAFTEVLRLDPKNEYALLNLQKLHEDQHQWSEAYDTRRRLTKLAAIDSRPQSQAILAFLENEIGLEAMRRQNLVEAGRRFQAAIDLDTRAVPAYLNLGDVRIAEGNEKEAAAVWEQLVHVAPDRAYLAFNRLEALARRAGTEERFSKLCRRLIADNPQDWRARLALARHLAAGGGHTQDTLELLFAALVHNPHALSIHQAIWRALGQLRHPPALVDRYGQLTQHAVFYLDPHVCTRCRYRSTELLWQCPHCHDWNTFVEERIAPAQEVTEVEA